MNKIFNYSVWTVIVMQALTGIFHTIGLLADTPPKNDTEKQLMALMDDYHMPDGMGFSPTVSSLFFALSACFSLLCFMGAMLNFYLLRKKVSPGLIKGINGIQAIIFGVCFVIMLFYTFLPPVVCTGLIFAGCLAVFFTAPRDINLK